MAIIQWFPGHMAKALRQVKENLKLVDVVLELVDARLPESSRNPQLRDLLQDKPSIIVLTKMDLADPKETRKWIEYYEKMGQPAVAINSVQGSLKVIDKKIKEVLAEKLANKKARGILSQRIKVMCIGIPNVGKSTLLNHLVKKNVAQVGNRPGVTKSQQWLKAGKDLQLLDTPGILWPKFEDPIVGKKLALTGAIISPAQGSESKQNSALEKAIESNNKKVATQNKEIQAEKSSQASSVQKASSEQATSRSESSSSDSLTQAELTRAQTLPITAVGDSVLADASATLQGIFPNMYVDAKVGRQVKEAIPVLQSLAQMGKLSDTVLISEGTNGPFTEDEMQQIMTILGDKRKVYWINVHVPTRRWQDQVNDDLKEAAKKYHNLKIIDWYAYSKDHADWFYGDNVHPNPEGLKYYGPFVAKQILK